MKIISLTCVLFLLLVGHVLAISSINNETIKEAQDYGKINGQHNLKEFLLPWTSYEENAVNLNETAERAYLYTPFLLVATDAREKSLTNQSVSVLDSEKVVADYTELLSFSIVLLGEKQDFAQNASVVIQQGKKVLTAYEVNIPLNTEKIDQDTGKILYKAQCYFYFAEKDIELDAPVKVSITTSDKKEHSFYFDLAKIK